MKSILIGIICMFIMAYCGAKLFYIGKTVKLRSSNDIFVYLFGEYIGNIFKVIIPVFCLCSFVVMISGAGSAINQYFGINKSIGVIILALLSLISVMMGIEKVLYILGNIGPIVIVVVLSVSIISITKNYDQLSNISNTVNTIHMTKAVDNWWMSAIIYSGLNIILSTQFLVGAGKNVKSTSTCIWAGVIGGIMYIVAAMFMNMALLSDIQNIYSVEIPTLYLAKNISNVVGIIFAIILNAEIYTTAAPLLWNVCSSCAEEKTKSFNIMAIFCTILGIFGGMLPFSYLVSFMYPISGAVGIMVIVALLLKGNIKKIQYIK
ncbi:MAG: YkvI family membrane protein [Peptostreptococcaceae bacterium]